MIGLQDQIRAVGIGYPPAGVADDQASVLAREAAIAVAERNLLKAIQGVQITSELTVENLVLQSDVIKEKVEGILHGAVVIHERAIENGGYEVVVALSMYGGQQSLSSAIGLPDQLKAEIPPAPAPIPAPPSNPPVSQPAPAAPAVVSPAPQPAPAASASAVVAPAPQPAPLVVSGDYTGLLIDCRGLKLAPAMCPVIRDEGGNVLYPCKDISTETLNDQGVALYYHSDSEVKNSARLGNHPLIIKAIRVEGAFKYNPVVSSADAVRILAEDARTKFLDSLAVAFLVDP